MVRHQITTRPRMIATMMILGKAMVDRSPKVLKLGYFTVLTIMMDKNTSTMGRMYFNFANRNSLSFSLSLMMSSVSEATSPAAEGMGKPKNSLLPEFPGMAARQLNRASLKAPHNR